jgi:excisionase family DNA binding protein
MTQQPETPISKDMQLYSVEEVAEILSVSMKLVYDWVKQGVLPAKRLGPYGRLIRISQADLEAFINTDFK